MALPIITLLTVRLNWGLLKKFFRTFGRSAMLSRAVVNCGIPLRGGGGIGDRFLDKKN